MGLFSNSTKIQVSSVVYNLAGDVNLRPNILRNLVMQNVLGNTPKSMGETILDGHVNGSGTRLRHFASWARRSGYLDTIGQQSGKITVAAGIDNEILAQEIPHGAKEAIIIQTSEMDWADYGYWADEYVARYFPAQYNTAWVADFDESTNEIIITFPSGDSSKFIPIGFNKNDRYIYATYILSQVDVSQPITRGDWVTLNSWDTFPSTNGWNVVSLVQNTKTQPLRRIIREVTSYSDGRPDEVQEWSFPSEEVYEEIDGQWERTSFIGPAPWDTNKLMSVWSSQYQKQYGEVSTTTATDIISSEVVDVTVVKTVRRTTTTDFFKLIREYKADQQQIIHYGMSGVRNFRYKEKSGNPVLDSMFTGSDPVGGFFPVIPIRHYTNFLNNFYLPDIYRASQKAVRKGIDKTFKDMVDLISDNPNIRDIDFAYMVWGVSLNVEENACKSYLYTFFRTMMEGQAINTGYTSWEDKWKAADQTRVAYQAWWESQQNSGVPPTEAPEVMPYPEPPNLSIQVKADKLNYDTRISWVDMHEDSGGGLAKPDAKVNEFWFEKGITETFTPLVQDANGNFVRSSNQAFSMGVVKLYHQVSSSRWRCITLWGLRYTNLIYGGKGVEISAHEALDSQDESGFIIPLHEEIYRRTPLRDATQMSTACCFLVFNCYQVYEQKWYSKGFFQVFLIVAAIAISIYSGGAGAGLLGANAAVGATLGFTGVAALVAGAVANAVAAMIVTQIITKVSTFVFGDRVGLIIASIASYVAISAGTSMANGQSWAAGFSDFMRAENLMKISSSLAQGYSGYTQAQTAQMTGQVNDMLQSYQEQSRIISQAYEDNLATNLNLFNPITLTDSAKHSFESREDFLARTLLVGTDIADMTHKMISHFSEMTVNTNLSKG